MAKFKKVSRGESRLPHQEDAFIRRFGFTICSRPDDSEPMWKRGEANYFAHSQALAIARQENQKYLAPPAEQAEMGGEG